MYVCMCIYIYTHTLFGYVGSENKTMRGSPQSCLMIFGTCTTWHFREFWVLKGVGYTDLGFKIYKGLEPYGERDGFVELWNCNRV